MKCHVNKILTSKSAWNVCAALWKIKYPIPINLLADIAGVPPPIALRTLSQLQRMKVIRQQRKGQQCRSILNEKHPAYPELCAVFDVLEKQPAVMSSHQTTRTLNEVFSFNRSIQQFIHRAKMPNDSPTS